MMGSLARLLVRTAFLVAAAASLATGAAAAAHGGELRGVVVAVSDGDTLTVLSGSHTLRVRLSDIDAPERGQPYGRRARQSLADLCHRKPAVVLPSGKDKYGRVIGVVTCSGLVANREQVRRGYAWVYSRYARRDSPLYAMQSEARAERRGLWHTPDPLPPWEWRSRRRSRISDDAA